MGNSIEDLLRTSTQMKGVMEPYNVWKNILDTGSSHAIKSKLPLYGLSNILNDLGKNSAFESKNIIDSFVGGLAAKTDWAGSPTWDSILGITGSQYDITSTLSKTLSLLPAYHKPQVATPSFLQDILGRPAVDYNHKVSSLSSVLSGLSSQIALKGFTGIDHDLLQSFAERTKEAASITTEITEKEYATKNDIERLENFIGSSLEEFGQVIKQEIRKAAKSPLAIISLWVTVISIILTIYTIVQSNPTVPKDSTTPKVEYATKQQVQDLKKFVEQKFEETLKAATKEAKLRINSKLKIKPRVNSTVLITLKTGETVHIIKTWHKWAQITIIDPADHLPISGWILKKQICLCEISSELTITNKKEALYPFKK